MKAGGKLLFLATTCIVAGLLVVSWVSAGSRPKNGVTLVSSTKPSECSTKAQSPGRANPPAKADKPIETYRLELLEFAFREASSLPAPSFAKDRASFQETVVDACIELDQTRLAARYLEDIEGWRKGAAHADLAFHHAQRGENELAESHLEAALAVAASAAGDEDSQDWQLDRIKVKCARAYAILGRIDEADALQKNVEPSETGKLDAVKAKLPDQDTFDAQIATLDKLAAIGTTDPLRNGVDSCIESYDRNYDDPQRRSQMEAKIKVSQASLPTLVRVDNLLKMGAIAAAHHDAANAADLANLGRSTLDLIRLRPIDRLPRVARQASVLSQAGDRASARKTADEALAAYDAQRDQIVNMERADVLRPIAEAYQEMGDTTSALNVYTRAVDEGAENPNQWPRAHDLVATCCSMALHGAEPYESLKLRMRQLCDDSSQPR
jgi:hypothetical protein